jgi:hypothetical protein
MENQQEKELSHEELMAKKEEMMNFYTEALPYLKVQHEYEDLLFKIDQARFNRTNIQMQYAMLMEQLKNAENETEPRYKESTEEK